MTRAQTQQTLRQLPIKWALALLALIVVYAVAQPALNSRFGWSLPSLARLMGEPEPKSKVDDEKKSTKASQSGKVSQTKSDNQSSDENDETLGPDDLGGGNFAATAQEPTKPAETKPAETKPAGSKSTSSQSTNTKAATNKSASSEPASTKKTAPQADSPAQNDNQSKSKSKSQPKSEPNAQPKTTTPAGDPSLLYGILKEVGRDRYVSIEGLQYNPGSEEGHRLKHLERHLQDIPDRPGKHGVFDGELKDALKWIDDAYARGKRGAKGVTKTQEDNRTVYEVPFSQPIGYIGGRDGKRNGNPPAKRLRLVVEGSRFVTAFPY